MANYTKIVYLMLENRSLDNVLGWLYSNGNPLNVIPAGSSPVFNGLQTGNYSNPDSSGFDHPVTEVPPNNQNTPTFDPHETFQHVQNQIYYSPLHDVVVDPPFPAMQGFYVDFATVKNAVPDQIMQCYTPGNLPILNLLASMYAVSDAYYSSIPTQTNCNRAFAATGNSIGTLKNVATAMVNNHWNVYDPVEFTSPTIWDVLNNNGYSTTSDWMIYYKNLWLGHGEPGDYCFTQDLLWPSLQNCSSNITNFSNFLTAAKNGTLPTFSFLEPSWYEVGYGKDLSNGTDYHPPANLNTGEVFLLEVYFALFNSPDKDNILFVINFDEHGGTYDHVPPPAAIAPWADASDGTAAPAAYEFDFQFDSYGVRVPLILVSTKIPSSTVFRSETNIPYDHTSVIATVLNLFNIPKSSWQLGSRVANAPTFENVVSLTTPREDIQELKKPLQPAQKINAADLPPNDLQVMVSHRMLVRELSRSKLPKEKFKEEHEKRFADVKTLRELIEKVDEMMRLIKEYQ